jgi:hypothetical protein
MPLWDAARAQVDLLKSASDIDPDADFILFNDISQSTLYRELISETRGLIAFSIETSANTLTAPTSTTLPFRSLRFPCRFRVAAISCTVEFASSTGVAALAIDVLNSGMSIIGAAAGVSATGRLTVNNGSFFGSVAVGTSMELINQYDRIDLFIAANSGGARAPIVHLIGCRA